MIFKNILVLVFCVVASISSLQASSLLKDTRQLSKRLYSIFIPPRDTQRTPKLVSGCVDFFPGPQAEMILNRPAVGNAISAPMAFDMNNILAYCETDSSIKEVVIKSSSSTIFSAGGDIPSIIDPLLENNKRKAIVTFALAYLLVDRLVDFPKPTIAEVEGFAVGAGMSLAMHARSCVVKNKAVFSTPETSIGLFTDSGALCFYNRLPRSIALYLALTGAKITHEQARQIGLVKSNSEHIPSSFLPPVLEDAFSSPTLEGIFDALSHSSLPEAQKCLERLKKNAPTALAVTFEMIRRGPQMSNREIIEQDFTLAQAFCELPVLGDFLEGTCALFEKDYKSNNYKPQWLPALDPASIRKLFTRREGQPGLFDRSVEDYMNEWIKL
jgi:enoyl-CoA hydratase/carnithine racemase